MHAFHTTRAGSGRRTLLPDEERLRAGARALVRVASSRLLLFSLVDDHEHDVTGYDTPNRRSAGNVARAISLSLRPIVDVPAEPARVLAVESRAHMKRLLRYVWRQTERHGLPVNPILWSGSSFLDTIGARWIGGWRPRLRAMLPKLTMAQVMETMDLPLDPFVPLTPDLLRELGAMKLAAAAAAALAASPRLDSNRREVVLARAATAHIARKARIPTKDVTAALRFTRRGISRLASRDLPLGVLQAVRKRLGLEIYIEQTERARRTRSAEGLTAAA